ncbi:MAG: enoyl-CoA hydratase/isomerase family protein, partial [Rhodospirillaceae bacterium]|nr:enoyl-CoA hydratase/isomerase family protein [Rhodospirillaceae bacterium]
MDQYETLSISRTDGLMWIAFNRPQVLNAFNLAQWRDLKAVLDSAAG